MNPINRDTLLAALVYYAPRSNSIGAEALVKRFQIDYETAEDLMLTFDSVGAETITALIIGDWSNVLTLNPKPSVMRHLSGGPMTQKSARFLIFPTQTRGMGLAIRRGTLIPQPRLFCNDIPIYDISESRAVVIQLLDKQLQIMTRLFVWNNDDAIANTIYRVNPAFIRIWKLHKNFVIDQNTITFFSSIYLVDANKQISVRPIPSTRLVLPITDTVHFTEIGKVVISVKE